MAITGKSEKKTRENTPFFPPIQVKCVDFTRCMKDMKLK
jgi:hypothetical protein